MPRLRLLLLAPLAVVVGPLAGLSPLPAQEARPAAPAPAAESKSSDETKTAKEADSDKPSVTHGSVTIGGRTIPYTASAGYLPLKDADGTTEARIFYVSYTADEVPDRTKRPLLFSFNGGPGSSSVWLHLGALGPKRVAMPDGPTVPAPPFRLVENGESWLDKADLVFIDPVETGFSRASKADLNRKFHGLTGDIASIGEFVRMYLTRNERWTSPLFVIGESYGTTRAAGLADYLADNGIALNGVILVSSVLDYGLLSSNRGNDLPYILYLPTFASTAWYHKALAPDLQALALPELLRQVEAFANGDYRTALAQGDQLQGDARTRVLDQLARFTGLPRAFVDQNDLRINTGRFFAEILRGRRQIVGRYDSRYLATVEDGGSQRGEQDPSYSAVQAPYTATFNQYVRAVLGVKTDTRYNILGSERIGRWDFGNAQAGFPETAGALRSAMGTNPHLKVWIASGYYDLATPYRGAEQAVDRLHLGPDLRPNVRLTYYNAGHMMYLDAASLRALKADASRFIDDADGL